jgi:hypothetical protein
MDLVDPHPDWDPDPHHWWHIKRIKRFIGHFSSELAHFLQIFAPNRIQNPVSEQCSQILLTNKEQRKIYYLHVIIKPTLYKCST